MVTDDADEAVPGPVLLVASMTLLAASRTITVPSDSHTTLRVIVTPNGLDGAKTQPVAVPVFEKSATAKPDIRSLNVKLYDKVRDEEGEDGGVNTTVAPAVSATVVVGAIPETPGVSGATVDIARRIQRPRTCETAYGGCDVVSRVS